MPALAILGRVPLWVWALVAALAWGAVGHRRASATATEFEQYRAAQTEATLQATVAARTEEARRIQAQQEIIHAQTRDLARARADAAAAGTAAARLRALLARSASGATPGDPAAASQRPPAGAVADVLGACVERYRSLAADADAARNAGLACERSYDALIRRID